MNLTLRQLRAFVAVAEHNRFALAAEHLHLTPSALSMLIKDLESELGVKLLDRHTRMVRVTEAGREFLGAARRVLQDLDIAVLNSRERAACKHGKVAVASASVLAVTLLVPFMREFQAAYPGVRVVVRDTAEENIRDALLAEEADIGIGTYEEAQSEITETELFRDTLVALIPEQHPLARKRSVAWSELAQWPFIALSPGSPIRRDLDAHLTAQGIRLDVAYEASFPSTVFALVSNGMGIAVLPANSRQLMNMPGIAYRPLGKPKLMRRVCAFHLKHRSLSPAAGLFHTLLLDYVRAHRSQLTVQVDPSSG
ncbi:LysR family transcriptional regulator [Paraburkholderia sp. J63]|uniref:LysR family transcriptional regulator n=1 Tax=Paraburkholderia sp. J63 TaxID=2805434 RepID=UPI002ABDE97D|nr:LysR family transcriptional regulator [Paraburkholderia sp. J63]